MAADLNKLFGLSGNAVSGACQTDIDFYTNSYPGIDDGVRMIYTDAFTDDRAEGEIGKYIRQIEQGGEQAIRDYLQSRQASLLGLTKELGRGAVFDVMREPRKTAEKLGSLVKTSLKQKKPREYIRKNIDYIDAQLDAIRYEIAVISQTFNESADYNEAAGKRYRAAVNDALWFTEAVYRSGLKLSDGCRAEVDVFGHVSRAAVAGYRITQKCEHDCVSFQENIGGMKSNLEDFSNLVASIKKGL